MRFGAAKFLSVLCGSTGVVLATALLSASVEAAPEHKMVAAGKLKLAGRYIACGVTPTQLSSTFWDYGGAARGRIILNPVKLAKLPEAVRLWVYAHECGHQIYGARETRADCYAVQRGRREGWLEQAGLNQICAFLSDNPGDHVHPAGPKRCAGMAQCFRKVKPPRASR